MKLETQLQELITRFCYRNGRHGETYLLEEGLRKGLGRELLALFEKAMDEVIGKDTRHAWTDDEMGRSLQADISSQNQLRAEMRKKVKYMTNQQTDKEKVE